MAHGVALTQIPVMLDLGLSQPFQLGFEYNKKQNISNQQPLINALIIFQLIKLIREKSNPSSNLFSRNQGKKRKEKMKFNMSLAQLQPQLVSYILNCQYFSQFPHFPYF